MQGVEAEWTPDNGTYKIYNAYSREISGDDIGYWFSYDNLSEGEQIEVSVGVSFVSADNALENLNAEQASSDFDTIHDNARRTWASELNKIEVEGGTAEQKTVFYTALYHTLIHPNILQDVNGQYPMMESGANGVTDRNRYTVFSLWDTFRALHPLMSIIDPDLNNAYMRSLLLKAEEGGVLPMWELAGNYTGTMIGYHAASLFADAVAKGQNSFDVNDALKASLRAAEYDTAGIHCPAKVLPHLMPAAKIL